MKRLLEISSWLALGLLITAPVLFFAGRIDLDQSKFWMMIATIVWFAGASFWIGRKESEQS